MFGVNVTEAPTPKPDNPPFQVLTNGSTLSYILWGATAFALVILSLRLIIAFIQRARRRFQHNSPIHESRSRQLTDPPPRYSDLSIQTLPPTYSQACILINYRPSVPRNFVQLSSPTNSLTGAINSLNNNNVPASQIRIVITPPPLDDTLDDDAPTRSSNYYTSEPFVNDGFDEDFEVDFTVRPSFTHEEQSSDQSQGESPTPNSTNADMSLHHAIHVT